MSNPSEPLRVDQIERLRNGRGDVSAAYLFSAVAVLCDSHELLRAEVTRLREALEDARLIAFEEAAQVVYESSYCLPHVDGERCDTSEILAGLEAARDRKESKP